ncbi:MAG: hypothetical protein M1501_00015 [Candidatus Omnitrophica bacterium]|nr:hypothetical protein [Candidatus Omnitrophota bacterium]
MNKYNVKILDRNYILVTEKNGDFVEKLENIVNKTLKKIRAELPVYDFVDSFITYIFQLFEQCEDNELKLKYLDEKNINSRKKLKYLKEEINTYIEKYTR